MNKLYVNLHSDCSYSNIIIQGYINKLKEYINAVDWLMWDFFSIKGRPMIRCMGNNTNSEDEKEKHIKRTDIFLQRILNDDPSVEVYIRDSRGDGWQTYNPTHKYTTDEMLDEEINIAEIIEDIELSEKYIARTNDAEDIKRIAELKQLINDRRALINNIWKV